MQRISAILSKRTAKKSFKVNFHFYEFEEIENKNIFPCCVVCKIRLMKIMAALERIGTDLFYDNVPYVFIPAGGKLNSTADVKIAR